MSQYPEGTSQRADAPWNKTDAPHEHSCTQCGKQFEIETDDDGRELPVVEFPITEIGYFCSDSCWRRHREARFAIRGLHDRITRVRNALAVLTEDMPHILAVANDYEPDYVRDISLDELAELAEEFGAILDREGK